MFELFYIALNEQLCSFELYIHHVEILYDMFIRRQLKQYSINCAISELNIFIWCQ